MASSHLWEQHETWFKWKEPNIEIQVPYLIIHMWNTKLKKFVKENSWWIQKFWTEGVRVGWREISQED